MARPLKKYRYRALDHVLSKIKKNKYKNEVGVLKGLGRGCRSYVRMMRRLVHGTLTFCSN